MLFAAEQELAIKTKWLGHISQILTDPTEQSRSRRPSRAYLIVDLIPVRAHIPIRRPRVDAPLAPSAAVILVNIIWAVYRAAKREIHRSIHAFAALFACFPPPLNARRRIRGRDLRYGEETKDKARDKPARSDVHLAGQQTATVRIRVRRSALP
eukprot:805341-Rhodomonas_salina.1